MKPAISIVIPAFEEQDRLGVSVRTILRYIESEKLSAELIIVDDGSGDKTTETGKTVCAEFPEI
ncbi:MAG TPA: glycosyltransferase, partial [Pyrinomonadaceae bacterium]|nr:glycosyltransferase [Pyrinomonadaceae bacterium]